MCFSIREKWHRIIFGRWGFVDIILLLCWKVWSRNSDGSFVSFFVSLLWD
jgi:hypothetical protein